MLYMKKIKIKNKPSYSNLHFKGEYKNHGFTITDINGRVYVTFDNYYPKPSPKYLNALNKIEKAYLKNKKKNR